MLSLRTTRKREESRTKGLELWHAGQKTEAFDYFAASIDVSPTMAFEVIKVKSLWRDMDPV